MKTSVLLLALTLLAVGGVTADLMSWQVKCGVGDNVQPYGNDFSTRFGVDPEGTWNYDGRDAVHPPLGDEGHDLGFIYTQFYFLYYEEWPPKWKPWIDGTPEYPSPGLIKDTREPILDVGQPELWEVQVQAPIEGETMSFIWFMNHEPGFEVPLGLIEIKIWGNEDLQAAGIEGDLILTNYGECEHRIEGIPQFGKDPRGNPIPHFWVIEAYMVPEPAVAQLAGLMLGIAGLGIARFRRK